MSELMDDSEMYFPTLKDVWEMHLQELKSQKMRQYFPAWDGDESLADLDGMDFMDFINHLNGNTGNMGDYELEDFYKLNANIQHLARNAIDGDWDSFQTGVLYYHQLIPDAFEVFYPYMPEEYRRDFVLRTYRNGGDEVEECREAVMDLPREGAGELPKELQGKDEITVYRAGLEPMDEAPYCLSWTISPDVANFFYLRHDGGHVYKAHIRPADVIAYSDEIDEKELLQYEGVYGIEEIEADIEAGKALGERFEQHNIEAEVERLKAIAPHSE